MLIYAKDDIFQSPAKIFVTPTTLSGIPSKEISAKFKTFFPGLHEAYSQTVQTNPFEMGQLWLYRTPHKWVLCFPVRRSPHSKATLENIEKGLQRFANNYDKYALTSISFPNLLYSGDTLNWRDDVRPLLEYYLNPLPISVFVHDETLTTESSAVLRTWLKGEPQTISVSRFWRDLARLLTRQQALKTANGQSFVAVLEVKRTNKSIIIVPENGKKIFISGSSLSDVWLHLRSAGYLMTDHLSGGLDEHAHFIFALIARLPYVKQVLCQTIQKQERVSLVHVPPLLKTAKSLISPADNKDASS